MLVQGEELCHVVGGFADPPAVAGVVAPSLLTRRADEPVRALAGSRFVIAVPTIRAEGLKRVGPVGGFPFSPPHGAGGADLSGTVVAVPPFEADASVVGTARAMAGAFRRAGS